MEETELIMRNRNYRYADCCFNCKHCSLYDNAIDAHWCQKDIIRGISLSIGDIKKRVVSEYGICDAFEME